MDPKRSSPSSSPVRVRQEPATVAEAVAAAQALTPDLEQQVEITAGLMGLTPDEVRPFVLAAPPLNLQRSAAPPRHYTGTDVSRRGRPGGCRRAPIAVGGPGRAVGAADGPAAGALTTVPEGALRWCRMTASAPVVALAS